MDEHEALAIAEQLALTHLDQNDRQGTFIDALFPLADMSDDDLRCVIDQLASLTAGLAVQLGDLRRGFRLPQADARALVERKVHELHHGEATAA